ncbi:MAG TPA: IclR family transcriptional regulator [Ktedonobacteraceae bacterium]|jgi:DNA-binding IclR family transcriptional regulator|nr:IclR family transcriptional regulator [Ktedonobacteraceae bacterium]
MVKQFDAQHSSFLSPCEKGDLLNTVQRALNALNLVAEHPGGLLPREISQMLGINISTCYHILNTLVAARYLDRDQDRSLYVLGSQVPFLNNAFVQGLAQQPEPVQFKAVATPAYSKAPTYIQRLQPILHRLTEQTQEPSYLACWHHEEVMIHAIVEAPNAPKISSMYVGYLGQAHAHALGKVLLAYSDPAFLRHYLTVHPLTQLGPNTIVQGSQLLDDLNLIVQQGYSIDREEFSDNICCLAAPIFAPHGQVVAALSISITSDTLKRRAEWLITQVNRFANYARAELRLSECP